MSFTEKLDPESLKAFNVVSHKKFSEQAQFFLNAFWDEFGDQAELIYTVHWDHIKKADMRVKGVKYVHLYEEGNELDFDMSLYFFEQLGKFIEDPKNAKWKTQYPKGIPQEMTAIKRKAELRERVDVNFDGKMSLLEFVLYQFGASPKTLMERSHGCELPPEVLAAIQALDEVNALVKAFETEKKRLEDDAEGGEGIKALKAKNELAQLKISPQWDRLNKSLITAEAAVRIASKKYGVTAPSGGVSTGSVRTNGTMWWLNRELQTKKELYGK
jgi:hypothetical protein